MVEKNEKIKTIRRMDSLRKSGEWYFEVHKKSRCEK